MVNPVTTRTQTTHATYTSAPAFPPSFPSGSVENLIPAPVKTRLLSRHDAVHNPHQRLQRLLFLPFRVDADKLAPLRERSVQPVVEVVEEL